MTDTVPIRYEETATRRPSVRVISAEEEFDALAPAWNALLEDSEATVFQTWEWQRTWWKYFGRGRRLRILLFESDGVLRGIAPLFLEQERMAGLRFAAWLRFVGVELSDYLSVITRRGSEAEVLGEFAGWLSDHRRTWDVFDLEDVPETSPSFRLLPSLLEARGMKIYPYQGNVCPRIDLPPSESELMKQLGPSAAYNLKRKQKRLQANFPWGIRLISRPDDPIEEAVGQFAVIHGGRWKSQGHPSAFDDPNHLAFHVEMCRRLAERDWLRIFFLDIGSNPAAVCFSFNYRSTIYMYQSNAHGSDEMMKCSPGLLVRATAMIEGIREGNRVFDFMRGNESYKYREWAATDIKNWLIRASSPTFGGAIRFYLFLTFELARKAVMRVRMEYYDYRRYRISGMAEEVPVPVYAMDKAARLMRITGGFIARHFPGPPGKSNNVNGKAGS